MGTRWRGLLAPIGVPTGDGRRFKAGGVTHRELPLGLKWQRSDEMGHDSSVIIGDVQQVHFGTVTEALENEWITPDAAKASGLSGDTLGAWGVGELYDDVDTAALPRLAEDVAEAALLTRRGVIGPSVDAGMAEAIMVEPGSDEPISEERWEQLWDEAWESGNDPVMEVLFTTYEIAAATLVTVPAFAQCLPFVLDTAEDDTTPDGAATADSPAEASAASTQRAVALVAAAGPYGPVEAFADPTLSGVTAITIADPDPAGVRRVFGHVAAFGVCHVGIRDACTTAPTSPTQYASFHRYSATASGHSLPVAAGRMTVAHGQLTGACACCPGIDDHACNNLAMGPTLAHYDRARPVAYVRAGEDQFGIWVAGVLAPEADEADIAALARQKVSGDWREVAGALELVEVLTLNREKPGFPLPRTTMSHGRQVSLVAAGTVSAGRTGRPARPGSTSRPKTGFPIDYERIGASVAAALAPFLPPGATAERDTTPLPAAAGTPVAAVVAAADPDAVPETVDGMPDVVAAAAASLEAALSAVAAADAAADLERTLADV